MKTCNTCDETKPAEGFYKQSSNKDGLKGKCKACVIAAKKQWRQDNPERHREHNRNYGQRNPERQREHARNYIQRNPEVIRTQRAAERIKHFALAPDLTPEEYPETIIQRLMIRVKTLPCRYCGTVIPAGSDWREDHWVALAKGGTDRASNIVSCCQTCNRRKHTKDPYVFLEQLAREGYQPQPESTMTRATFIHGRF